MHRRMCDTCVAATLPRMPPGAAAMHAASTNMFRSVGTGTRVVPLAVRLVVLDMGSSSVRWRGELWARLRGRAGTWARSADPRSVVPQQILRGDDPALGFVDDDERSIVTPAIEPRR